MEIINKIIAISLQNWNIVALGLSIGLFLASIDSNERKKNIDN